MSYRSIISDASVLNAHTIGVGVYTTTQQAVKGTFAEQPSGNGTIRYDKVRLQDSANNYLFDRDISWEFLSDSQLINQNQNGKVARLCNVKLKQRNRRSGLGFDMHMQQYNIFKSNEFKQIQLTAKWDGVIAWPSMYFKFNDEDDEDELLEHISGYMIDILGYNTLKVKGIMKNYTGIKDLNSVLKPANKIWFTDWYQRNNKTLRYDMYKDIV